MVPLADQLLYSRLTSNSSLLYSPGIDTEEVDRRGHHSNYFSFPRRSRSLHILPRKLINDISNKQEKSQS